MRNRGDRSEIVPKIHSFDGRIKICAHLCVRTTIELPDRLIREAKKLTAQKGITLKEFFTNAVEKALLETPRETRRMIRPPIIGKTSVQIPARSNEELAGLLEAEDLKNFP